MTVLNIIDSQYLGLYSRKALSFEKTLPPPILTPLTTIFAVAVQSVAAVAAKNEVFFLFSHFFENSKTTTLISLFTVMHVAWFIFWTKWALKSVRVCLRSAKQSAQVCKVCFLVWGVEREQLRVSQTSTVIFDRYKFSTDSFICIFLVTCQQIKPLRRRYMGIETQIFCA